MSDNVTTRLSFRAWLWCLWHTRPGHKPAGIVYNRRSAFCTACGARCGGGGDE